jgi:hypothetical protein
MKIKMSFFIQLLFCACCCVTLSAYGMYNIKNIQIDVSLLGLPVPKDLKIVSKDKSFSGTPEPRGMIRFDCSNINGPESGEEPNKLSLQSGNDTIATITIDQCYQATTPKDHWECDANISCNSSKYNCSMDSHWRPSNWTPQAVFGVLITGAGKQ